jgi:hypothetical protein
MSDQPAFQSATTSLPQSANGTSPQVPAAPSAPESGQMHTRISGMRASLMGVGTARITQLRQIMRRKPRAS